MHGSDIMMILEKRSILHLEAGGSAQRVRPHSSTAHMAWHTPRPEAYDWHIAWHITAPTAAKAFVPQKRYGTGISVPTSQPKDTAPNTKPYSNSELYSCHSTRHIVYNN